MSDGSRCAVELANPALPELASGEQTILDADRAPISLDDLALQQATDLTS